MNECSGWNIGPDVPVGAFEWNANMSSHVGSDRGGRGAEAVVKSRSYVPSGTLGKNIK